MFLRGEKTQIGAVVLAVVLAMTVAAPAGAAGWGGWSEARGFAEGFLTRTLGWLSPDPEPSLILKCSSSADPNGCAKTARQPGSRVDLQSRTDTIRRSEGRGGRHE